MKQTRSTRRTKEGGFTLIELLIATAVAMIVLLVITATYFGALQLHNSTVIQIQKNLVLQRTLDLMQRDLTGIMLPAGANSVLPIGTFSGQFQDTPTDSLIQETSDQRISPDFYTTSGSIDGWNQFSEVQVVAYFLAPTSDGTTKNLVRAVTRNLLAVQTPVTDEQVLLTGLTDAEFEYYDGAQWDQTWDSTQTSSLPLAIRVHLTMARTDNSGTQPQPIELFVPVLVSTTTTSKAIINGTIGQ